MDLSSLSLFQRLNERIGWLNARQKVLAQNIANADTPGYVPNDVVPMDFGDHLKKLVAVTPDRTDPKHLVGTIPEMGQVEQKRTKKQYETAPVGNSVILEEQMMKLSQTQMDYSTVINLYRKHVDLIKTAIGRNG